MQNPLNAVVRFFSGAFNEMARAGQDRQLLARRALAEKGLAQGLSGGTQSISPRESEQIVRECNRRLGLNR